MAWNQIGSLKGPTGATGPVVESADVDALGVITLTLSDATEVVVTGSALGPEGTSIVLEASVAELNDLPDNLDDSDTGKTFYVEAEGHLYYWSGSDPYVDVGEIKGAQGATGPVGVTGATGPQGVTGPAGTGIVVLGSLATSGELPSSGNTLGDAYLIAGDLWVWDGSDWVNAGSVQGATGPQGTTGPQGATGPVGPTGDPGVLGPSGATGATGPQGVAGSVGVTGATGPGVPSVSGQPEHNLLVMGPGEVTVWSTPVTPLRFHSFVQGTNIDDIVKITQAAYDLLSPPDSNTLYVIVG